MRTKKRPIVRSPIAEALRLSRAGLFAVVIFSLFTNLLKFAVPLYMLQVLDRIPASRSIETLAMLTVIVVLAIVAAVVLDIVRRKLMNHWSGWLERRFGPQIVQTGFGHGSLNEATDTRQPLTDLSTLSNFASGSFLIWLDVLWVPIFLLGCFIIHPLLGIIAAVSLVVVLVLGMISAGATRNSRKASSAAYREGDDLIRTADSNRESLRALGMGQALSHMWQASASDRTHERERIKSSGDVLRAILRAVSQLVRIAILAAGIWLYLLDEITIGSIFAARVMAGFALTPTSAIARQWRSLGAARRAFRSLDAYLGVAPSPVASTVAAIREMPLIFDGVGHRYPYRNTSVFRRLNFEVPNGKLLIVQGSAGRGKTTMARLITGLVEPRYGQVRIGDYAVCRLPLDLRTELIGYMPQQTELFQGTIRSNISRMTDAPLEEVVKLTTKLGIHDLILRLPEGYDTELGPDATCILSGSGRKRIAIARALFGSPRIVVLDEPSANLDRPSRRIMEQAIRDLKAEATIFVVTQAINSPQFERMADYKLTLTESGATFEDLAAQKRAANKPTALRRVK